MQRPAHAPAADDAFRPDCAQCAGLCCMALSFDAGDAFAIDKEAGVPCPNLDIDHRCTIHNTLTKDGFSGCVAFDCLGAGQRVSRDIFDAKSWQDHPALLRPMIDALRQMRQVQSMRQLLTSAAALPLSAPQEAMRQNLLLRIAPALTDAAALGEIETGPLPAAVGDFLQTLRPAAAGLRK